MRTRVTGTGTVAVLAAATIVTTALIPAAPVGAAATQIELPTQPDVEIV